MNRRWYFSSLLLVLMMTLFTAQACGPDFYPDVFVRKLRPDRPKEFAAGKLGVLLPTYPRADLAIAFRYLNGGALTEVEQQAYQPTESYETEKEWEDRWRIEDAEAKKTIDPAQNWMNARAKYGTLEPQVQQERSYKVTGPSGFSYNTNYLNCHGDAFRTAVLTLQSRAKTWGEKSADLADWLRGQDVVFVNCSGESPAMPADAPAGSSALLKADRAYQVAAAEFYAAQFQEARKSFEAIAQTPDSPWMGISRYLAARCLVREAFFAERSSSGGGLAGFDPKLMQEAAVLLELLVREKPSGVSQHAIREELNLVRLRLEPTARLHELAAALAGPKPDPDYDQHLKDLTFYLDAKLDGTKLREDSGADEGAFSAAYNDLTTLRSSATLVDWMITFQSPAKEARAHALAEWKKTHELYWLSAAIAKATERDAEAADLVTAAEQVKPDSPAWESLTYHRMRLLIALGRVQEARAVLDRVIAPVRAAGRDSSVNAYLGLRMRASASLNEFLSYAPRKVLQESSQSMSSLSECLDVMKNPKRKYDCKKEVSPVQFSRDAASFFNAQAPLTTLVEIAASDKLPEQLRRSVAMMAWVRSVLLKDDAAAAKLLPLLPEKLRQEAGSGTGFRPLVAIVRNPGLRPFLDTGVQRSYSYDFVESYRDNWWSVNWGTGDYGGYQTPMENVPFSFLTPDQLTEGRREVDKLMKLGSAEVYLSGLVLDYAKGHPDDQDVPESLYLVLRMMRYGAGPSWRDDPAAKGKANEEDIIGKEVSRLLRHRYAASPWTKRAAPFAE
jgi:hypothetical protein